MSNTATLNPTAQNYSELQRAYDHFNQALFDGRLPSCLITLQREKRTCGYFSQQRFTDLDGRSTDEIALNLAYFAVVPLGRQDGGHRSDALLHRQAWWQAHG